MSQQNTVFIAFRRDLSMFTALALSHALRERGYDVFMDMRRPKPAPQSVIYNQIKARSHFIMVFVPASNDLYFRRQWFRDMIEYAYYTGRNVIPVFAYHYGMRAPFWFQQNVLSHLKKGIIVRADSKNFDYTVDRVVESFQRMKREVARFPSPEEDIAIVKDINDTTRTYPSPSDQQLRAEYYLNRGEYIEYLGMLYNKNMRAGYMSAINKAIHSYPEYAAAYYFRSMAQNSADEVEAKLSDLNKAIAFDSQNARYYTYRGYMRGYDYKDLKGGIADYTEGIRIDPSCGGSYERRAILYNRAEEYELALQDQNSALQIEPANPRYYFGRSFTYEACNRIEEAIADLQKCLALIGNRDVGIKIHAEKRLETLSER